MAGEHWLTERRNPHSGEWIGGGPLKLVSKIADAVEGNGDGGAAANPLGVASGVAPEVNPALVEKVRTLRLQPGEGTRLQRYTEPQAGKTGQFDALYKMAKMSGIPTEGRDPGNVVEAYNVWTRQRLKALLDPARAHVAVRVTPAGLDGLLSGDRLRNTHDLAPDAERAKGRAWELNVWGAHPIYGYMAEDDEDVTGVVSAFGAIKLRLRDDVRGRATFTYSDSNYLGGDEGNVLPSSPDNPDPASVPYFTNLAGIDRVTMKVDPKPRKLPQLRDPAHQAELETFRSNSWTMPDAERESRVEAKWAELAELEGWHRWEHGDFFEAQILGDLRASDVQEAVFPPEAPPAPEVRARLESLGIRVRVQGQEQPPDQALHGLPAPTNGDNPLGIEAGTNIDATSRERIGGYIVPPAPAPMPTKEKFRAKRAAAREVTPLRPRSFAENEAARKAQKERIGETNADRLPPSRVTPGQWHQVEFRNPGESDWTPGSEVTNSPARAQDAAEAVQRQHAMADVRIVDATASLPRPLTAQEKADRKAHANAVRDAMRHSPGGLNEPIDTTNAEKVPGDQKWKKVATGFYALPGTDYSAVRADYQEASLGHEERTGNIFVAKPEWALVQGATAEPGGHEEGETLGWFDSLAEAKIEGNIRARRDAAPPASQRKFGTKGFDTREEAEAWIAANPDLIAESPRIQPGTMRWLVPYEGKPGIDTTNADKREQLLAEARRANERRVTARHLEASRKRDANPLGVQTGIPDATPGVEEAVPLEPLPELQARVEAAHAIAKEQTLAEARARNPRVHHSIANVVSLEKMYAQGFTYEELKRAHDARIGSMIRDRRRKLAYFKLREDRGKHG